MHILLGAVEFFFAIFNRARIKLAEYTILSEEKDMVFSFVERHPYVPYYKMSYLRRNNGFRKDASDS